MTYSEEKILAALDKVESAVILNLGSGKIGKVKKADGGYEVFVKGCRGDFYGVAAPAIGAPWKVLGFYMRGKIAEPFLLSPDAEALNSIPVGDGRATNLPADTKNTQPAKPAVVTVFTKAQIRESLQDKKGFELLVNGVAEKHKIDLLDEFLALCGDEFPLAAPAFFEKGWKVAGTYKYRDMPPEVIHVRPCK